MSRAEVSTASAAALATVIRFPLAERPLPTSTDLDRIAGLPLVQMFVVGRSGSGLVHAFLDSHPQVLHVPHTFKFYDFMAANPDLLAASGEVWIDRFIATPHLAFLFDSSRSVILGGRLGSNMETTVLIDPEQFRGAFLSAVAGRTLTPRSAFLAIVLAYGWVIGQDPAAAKVVFHHVHHGDWIWPEALVEFSNYRPALRMPSASVLKADRYVATVREPHDAFDSVVRFVDKLALQPGPRIDTLELLIRLLLQDWSRLGRAQRSGEKLLVVRLEDLRVDAVGAMRACAEWLGIDPEAAALRRLTYYGFEWFGDIYTSPASQVKRGPERPDLAWQDRCFVDGVLGNAPAELGYPVPTAAERWLGRVTALVRLVWPSPLLRNRALSGWRRYRLAVGLGWRRMAFVRRLKEAA